MEPLQLSTAQQFELERIGRVLDAETSPDDLRKVARLFLQAWFTQKAATAWVMRQQMSQAPPLCQQSPAPWDDPLA